MRPARAKSAASWHQLLLALFAAAIFYIVVWPAVQRHVAQRQPDETESAETCDARLIAHGLLAGPELGDADSQLPAEVLQRRKVYDHMAADAVSKGITLGGVITQGLYQQDLFLFQRGDLISTNNTDNLNHMAGAGSGSAALQHAGGRRSLASGPQTGATSRLQHQVIITPVLKPLDIPVRAMILPLLNASASQRIADAVEELLLPVLPPGAIWRQDQGLYHATLYHASSHMQPVPANSQEVQAEYAAIRAATSELCPVAGVLERVVITSTGVVVACWQTTQEGTEPVLLRKALAAALPHSPVPAAQMVKEPTMLHTTLARLLQPPAAVHGRDEPLNSQLILDAVTAVSHRLCGLATSFSEVWFVEEQDLLALALAGRYIKHPAALRCPAVSS